MNIFLEEKVTKPIEGVSERILVCAREGLTQIFLKTQEAFHAREAEEQPKVM